MRWKPTAVITCLLLALPTTALAGGCIPDDIIGGGLWVVLIPAAIITLEAGLLRRFYRLSSRAAVWASIWMNLVTFVLPCFIFSLENLNLAFPLETASFYLAKPWLSDAPVWTAWTGLPWGLLAGYVISRSLVEYFILAICLGKANQLQRFPVLPVFLVNAIAMMIYLVLLFCGLLFVRPVEIL